MLKQFISYVADNALVPQCTTTLVAVSGGVDSMVLVDLFKRAGLEFVIGHANFGLRGGEADGDEAFVHEMARGYGVDCYSERFDTVGYAKRHKLSIQMAARALRYEWFNRVLVKKKLAQVATGHHINDELETFLYNLAKGTGLNGLHGILPRVGSVIRPLGFASKAEIVGYAKSEKLRWREDESNGGVKYDRNWIRHEVVPALKVLNPNIEVTFLTRLTKLRQVESVFNEYCERVKKVAFVYKKPYYYVYLKLLPPSCPPLVVFEWIKEFGFSFQDLQRWWEKPPQVGKRLYTLTHWLLVERDCWVIGEKKDVQLTNHVISTATRHVDTAGYGLDFSILDCASYQIRREASVAALDFNKLSFPLLLRPWQAGDVFRPLGAGHSKKVSDFLIDCKVGLHEKSRVNVLLSNGEIAWVVGYRIDERFRLTGHTQRVYEIVMCEGNEL